MTLAELQARMAATIMSPLTARDGLARRTRDGKLMRREVEEIIKPNSRLTATDRLQIYSQSYWFRILDGLYDDFPGLVAVLGQRAFHRMARAYLTECPSRSYSMRNLGSRLPAWLETHGEFAGSAPELAVDMARLEWAHVEAFDGPEAKTLGPEDLLAPGGDLQVGLQPYLTLLGLRYPVDDFRLEAAGARDEQHDAASNAVGGHKRRALGRRFRRTRPEEVYVAVHRVEGSVWYRRLEREEFQVLEGLRAGKSIEAAVEGVPEEMGARVEQWFANWSRMGWLCAKQ